MNCYTHGNSPAVGICAMCQKAICHDCVGRDAPRLTCRDCVERGAVMFGFEYKSSAAIGTWPLVHICTGVDPVTMRPKAAKGVIAIGGLSIGLACALGGAALGLGLSVGGLALGSVAIGGAAIGFKYAIGGGAFGPSVIDGRHCDEAARDLWMRWLGSRPLPPSCNPNPFRLIQ